MQGLRYAVEVRLLGQLWNFLRVRKKLWLLPIVLITLLFGGLLLLAETSTAVQFIYTLF